jgi:hypothetical protein
MEDPDYRFGTSELRADMTHVTVPQQLAVVDIVEQGEPMVWAYSSAKGAVVVSNRRDLFENDDFTILGQTTVGENCVTQVSKEALDVLTPGTLYFILSPELGPDMCMVLDEGEARRRYEGL